MTVTQALETDLLYVDNLLYRAAGNLSYDLAQDPFRLDLPPANGRSNFNARKISVLAALYFQAELEFTGIILVADRLSEGRRQYNYANVDLLRMMETYARNSREWLSEDRRGEVFDRVFGLNPYGNQSGSANREFQNLLAQMCLQLSRIHQNHQAYGQMNTSGNVRLQMARERLIDNLARRPLGNAQFAAEKIQPHLRDAISLVGHPGVGEMFGNPRGGLWANLQAILQQDTPDLGRYVRRAQSGKSLIEWLGKEPSSNPEEMTRLAEVWMAASGMNQADGRIE